MKKFLINFKNVIQFLVSIIASREFAFIYCVFGTIAQTAHTYYLLDGISSLNGWWKITQSVLLSFFISSSLLYFTAISDNNDKSQAGKRVLNAVTLFMWLEIVINLYYYSKHIIIDTNNYNTNNLFQLAFGVLIACIIPVTIKLYSSQIRAKEWLDLDNDNNSKQLNKDDDLVKEIFENINLIAKRTNEIDNNIDERLANIIDLGTNPKNYIDNQIQEIFNDNLEKINTSIENSFNKHSELSLKQFENKLKMILQENQNNKSN